MILAIDPGLAMGWALGDNKKGEVFSGTWEFDNNPKGKRFQQYYDEHLAHVHNINRIVIEQPLIRGRHAIASLWGFIAMTEMWGYCNDVPVTVVHTSTWQAHHKLLKKGKQEHIKKAEQITGRKMVDDNEADAVLLLYWYLEKGQTT